MKYLNEFRDPELAAYPRSDVFVVAHLRAAAFCSRLLEHPLADVSALVGESDLFAEGREVVEEAQRRHLLLR